MQLSQQEIEKMLEGLVEGGNSSQDKVKRVKFSRFELPEQDTEEKLELNYIHDIQVELQAELAHTTLNLRTVLSLKEGEVLSLDKLSGEPADIFLNGNPFARGEIVVINEVFGIRMQEVLSLEEEDEF